MASAQLSTASSHHDDLRQSLAAEKVRLLRDGLVNYLGYICAGLSGLVLVPVLIGSLSRELYGVWIAGLALEYSLSFLNAGLGRSIAREVAVDQNAASPFVTVATNLYVALGFLGFLVIGGLGLPLSHGLHISSQNLVAARITFMLIGFAFLGEQALSAGLEILTGLRRFPAINVVMTASVVLRTAGMIVLAKYTSSLTMIAAWHGLICMATGIFALWLGARWYPQLRLRFEFISLSKFRPQLEFTALSQLAAACSNLLWRSASLVIGFRLGPSAIVPYEIGQKFPMYVSSLSWQGAEALLPAASEYHSTRRQAHTFQLIQIGTRGLLILAIPFSAILFIMAPQLVSVWTKNDIPGASLILRIMVIAVLADTAAAPSIQTLWAQARMGTVVKLALLSVLIAAGLVWPLLGIFGVAGAALALAISVCATSPLYALAVSRSCRCSLFQLWRPALYDLWLPTVICIVFVVLGGQLIRPASWVALFSIATVSGVAYLGSFYTFGAQHEERRLLQNAIEKVASTPRVWYRAVRHALGRVSLVRTLYFSAIALKDCALDSSARDRRYMADFYGQEDPFGFSRQLEQFRFQRALEILDGGSKGKRFRRAFEVGCSEGMFTEMLAPRCDSLLAVDLMEIAVDRARYRCRDLKNIDFAVWDSRSDSLEGSFDLIVATGVLEYIHRPFTLKRACDALVNALRPGGYLLVGTTLVENGVEDTWVGRKLMRGTVVNQYLEHDSRLETIATSLDQCVCPFAHVLLRKRQ